MSDTAEFILKLNDQVSGPAKHAADALRRMEERAASAAGARGMQKLEAATRRMGLAQLQAQKMNASFDKAQKSNTFLGGFGAKLAFRSVADYAKGAFLGDLAAKGVETIVGGFVSGAHAAVSLVSDGIKMAFHEGGKAENLRLSYKHLLGGAGGKEALDSIGGFAGKTRFDDDAIAEMMRPLFRAGLKGTGARTAFALASDASVRTGEDPSETIAALAKIQLKGGVTEKLLTSLGVGVRGFKDALAIETKSKNKEATFKLATEGKLDPMAIQNAIVRATEKQYGTKTGTATNEGASTMSARLQKLQDLPSQYLKKMSESPAWTTLSDKFGDVLKGLDPDSPRGAKIMASLFSVFNRLADAVGRALTPENMDKFVVGVSSALEMLKRLPDILNKILKVSEFVAAVWAGKAIVNAISGAVTGFAALGASSLAVVAPLLSVAAAIGSVYLAYDQISKTVTDLGGMDRVGDDLRQFLKNPLAKSSNDAADANMDTKYGGAGYKLKPANGNARPALTLSVGTVNVVAPDGADAKEHGEAISQSLASSFSSELELAAAQSGG